MDFKNLSKLSSFWWNFSQTFLIQGINFGVSIFLARILGPKEFGTVALAIVFISIGQTIMNGGLSQSVLRKQKVTHEDYNTLFFLNLFVAIFIYSLFFLSRKYIAASLNDEILISVIPLLSLLLIFNAFSIVQSTKLNKDLNFKKQFWINVPGTVFSCILGIYLANNGYGVYSLVYMQLFFAMYGVIVLWYKSNWFPDFYWNKLIFIEHLKFGLPLTLSNLLTGISNNFSSFIIAKSFTVTELGLFNRAVSLKDLPISNFANIIDKNTLPLFANHQHDKIYLKKLFEVIITLLLFSFIPLTIFLIINANTIIYFLLGLNWMGSVYYFKVLILTSTFQIMISISLNLLKILGKANLIFKIETFKNVLLILTAIASIFISINFLVWSISIITFLYFIAVQYYVKILLDFNFYKIIKTNSKALFILIIVLFTSLFLIEQFPLLFKYKLFISSAVFTAIIIVFFIVNKELILKFKTIGK